MGSFRLEREIGQGGMGSVYLASHVEGLDLRVAVKTIRPDLGDSHFVQRFHREREIVAQLDHPRIARVLDGGTHAGIPWFAMEYLEGQALDTWCNEHRLTITQRLALFLDVCEAVRHAHRNLIIHRDLKPGNIMVVGDGEVKLLDFGLAGILDKENRAHLTIAAGAQLMTPEYASPEQVRGDVLGVQSDVYSLGVILFELLSGHQPYEFSSLTLLDIHRTVCETEPDTLRHALSRKSRRPTSTRKYESITDICEQRSVRLPQLRRCFSGDLQSIVSKALEKNRAQRYADMDEFIQDLRHHLDGYPVGARRQTAWYRAGKFVRRHKVGVGVFCFFLLLLLGFALSTFEQKRRIMVERDLAQVERDRAREITRFMTDILRSANPNRHQGRKITVEEALALSVERIGDNFADQPENRALLLGTLGSVYRQLLYFDRARPLLEEAIALYQETDPNARELPHLLMVLGFVLMKTEDQEKAIPYLRQGVDAATRAFGPDDCRTLEYIGYLANTLAYLNQMDEADLWFSQLIPKARAQCADNPETMGRILSTYAYFFSQSQQREQALAIRKEAYRYLASSPAAESDAAANLLSYIAFDSFALGHKDALDWQVESTALLIKLFGPDHHRSLAAQFSSIAYRYSRGRLSLSATIHEMEQVQARLAEKETPFDDLMRVQTHLIPFLIKAGSHDRALSLIRDNLSKLSPNDYFAFHFTLDMVEIYAIRKEEEIWRNLLGRAWRHPYAETHRKMVEMKEIGARYHQGDPEILSDLLEILDKDLSMEDRADLSAMIATIYAQRNELDKGRPYMETVNQVPNPYSAFKTEKLAALYREGSEKHPDDTN